MQGDRDSQRDYFPGFYAKTYKEINFTLQRSDTMGVFFCEGCETYRDSKEHGHNCNHEGHYTTWLEYCDNCEDNRKIYAEMEMEYKLSKS